MLTFKYDQQAMPTFKDPSDQAKLRNFVFAFFQTGATQPINSFDVELNMYLTFVHFHELLLLTLLFWVSNY